MIFHNKKYFPMKFDDLLKKTLKVYEHFEQAPSTSKSRTISFVSSVPFRDPTAQINFVSFALRK